MSSIDMRFATDAIEDEMSQLRSPTVALIPPKLRPGPSAMALTLVKSSSVTIYNFFFFKHLEIFSY